MFQARTAFTVSTGKRLELYQNEVIALAYWVSPLHKFIEPSGTNIYGPEYVLEACNIEVDTHA